MLWQTWRLVSTLVAFAVISVFILGCYLSSKAGKSDTMGYIPGLLVLDLGAAIILARYLSLLPVSVSEFGRWTGDTFVVIGLVMVLIKRRREGALESSNVGSKYQKS